MVRELDAFFSQLEGDSLARGKYREQDKIEAIKKRLFQLQRDAIEDPSERKTLRCGRRSGKTFVAIAYMIIMALEGAKRDIKFITLTKQRARELVWDSQQGLKFFNDEFDLSIKFQNVFLTATFPNGSRIMLAGAENRPEAEKLRGDGFHLAIIDECKSFADLKHFEYVIEECLVPTTHDHGGTIVLMGTPGWVLQGPWYESSRPDSPVIKDEATGSLRAEARPYKERLNYKGSHYWSQHSWTAKENTATPDSWLRCLKEKEDRGWSENNPKWRREYLAEWFADNDARIFHFDPDLTKNGWVPGPKTIENPHGLPQPPPDEGWLHEYRFLLGLDFGDRDDTAFVVAAYADTNPTLYFIEDFKAPHLNISKMAAKIRELEARYGGFESIVGDQAAATTVRHLNEIEGIPVRGVKKQDKLQWIENINDDLHEGRIKVNQEQPHGEYLIPMALSTEWLSLGWDESGTREDKSTPNHASDAAVYLYRFSHHLLSTRVVRDPKPGEEGYDLWRRNKEEQAFIARQKEEASQDWSLHLEQEWTNPESLEQLYE